MASIVLRARPLSQWPWLALTVLPLCFLVVGCQPMRFAESSLVTPEGIETYSGGIHLMVDSLPSQRRSPESSLTFQVEPNMPLKGEIRLEQEYPDTKTIRLLLLLNYRQAPFALDRVDDPPDAGDPIPTLASPLPPATFQAAHDIIAPPDEALAFRFQTEPLATGYYDFALIVVLDSDKRQSELRYSTTFRPAVRRSIYVGDVTPPTMTFSPLDPSARANEGFEEMFIFVDEPYSLTRQPGRSAKPGEEMTFFLVVQPHASNLWRGTADDDRVPLALVAFFDDQLVPFNGSPVVYGSARPGYLSTVPVMVQAPARPGEYQFFIQQLPQPYLDVSIILDDIDGPSFFAESTQRIVITVEEE